MAPPPVTFISAGPINLPEFGPASPYPSSILVSGISNPVASIQIQLNQLTHTSPNDLDILLVSPAGQKMIIMSDVGTNPASLPNLASPVIPTSSAILVNLEKFIYNL